MNKFFSIPQCLALISCAFYLTSNAQPTLEPAFGVHEELSKQVAPGNVAQWRFNPQKLNDPTETGSLAQKLPGLRLADWYTRKGSPFVVVYVDRRLERLPSDWNGSARLMIAEEANIDGKMQTSNVTIGLEHRTTLSSVRDRTSLVKLVEDALVRELKTARFKLVDPTIAERALSNRTKGSSDTEYLALKGSAAFILEVELTPSQGIVLMIGSLKNINSGEIVANVRQQVYQDIDGAGTEVLARAFVNRMLATEVGE